MRYIITPSLTFYQHGQDKSDIAGASNCLLCDIPNDFHKTQKLIDKTVVANLEAIKTVFVLSVAFGAGYIFYKRFGGKSS